MKQKRTYDQLCGIAIALDAIGERWTLLLMRDLLLGPLRFSDLLEIEDGIGPNMLSKRLKLLVERGWVTSEPQGREKVYSVTDEGERLRKVLLALGEFGQPMMDPSEPKRRCLDWFAFSLQRRAKAPTGAPPVTVELVDRASQRVVAVRTEDVLLVQRGEAFGADARVEAELPFLAAWLAGGRAWRSLVDAGGLSVSGSEDALDAMSERFHRIVEE